jgi:hypothetical protein
MTTQVAEMIRVEIPTRPVAANGLPEVQRLWLDMYRKRAAARDSFGRFLASLENDKA